MLRPIDRLTTYKMPGLAHRTLAGAADGIRRLAVWEQELAPGSATPRHRHACEEVVIILEGSGEVELMGDAIPFGPRSTVIVPSDTVHRFVAGPDAPVRMIAALSTAFAVVNHPDGSPIPLPWQLNSLQ